ncbi:MAG: hypothetical protein KDB21_06445 [Acidimicrobiales bacterium]|nr:hypothetical protein [Acidimicrobiales bacterium]
MVDRSGLLALAQQVAPTTLAVQRCLPVDGVFDDLLPAGLARGQRVALTGPGATSLALALAGRPSQGGSWVAVVGAAGLGLAAAEELGVRLDRLVVVDPPPTARWGATVASLFDGFEIVIVAPGHPVSARDDRRLSARAREEGAVVLQLAPSGQGRWPGADVELAVDAVSWDGLGEGHGYLRGRRVTVRSGGRRGAARPRRLELWLPDPDGRLRPVTPGAALSAEGALVPGDADPPRLSSVG